MDTADYQEDYDDDDTPRFEKIPNKAKSKTEMKHDLKCRRDVARRQKERLKRGGL